MAMTPQPELAGPGGRSHLRRLLVCYDIADDDTRASVAAMLMPLGPRVQLSVFECQVTGARGMRELVSRIKTTIDPATDQVRVYDFGGRPTMPTIIGQRELEEWRDYMIV